MGIVTWVKQWLIKRYTSKDPEKNAFPEQYEQWARDKHGEWRFMLVIDMMQIMKYLPEGVETLGDLLAFIMNRVRQKIAKYKGRASVIVLCWDQKVTEHQCNKVKGICHATRYKGVDFYDEDKGPYLPKTMDGQLPPEWNRFCGNSNLLRRELYPHIYNCCLDSRYIQLHFGQRLVLQGLPGITFENDPEMKAKHFEYLTTGVNNPRSAEALIESQQDLIPWKIEWLPLTKASEQADPDLYNRVYSIEAIPPGVDHRFPNGFLKTGEWVEARNNLGEADLAMMFFDRFYPHMDQVIDINDGDIFPISLLYAQERLQGRTWRNRQLLQLPIPKDRKKKKKKKKKKSEEDEDEEEEKIVILDAPQLALKKKPVNTYCDVNMLYGLVCDDPLFGNAGVQNHIMTLVFMIILGGTDFFQDTFGGIGIPTIVWKTFTAKLDVLHHLIQSTKNIIPDPYALRTVVIDETAWRRFVDWCYVEKHGKAVRNKNKGSLSKKLIKVHLSKRKRKAEHFPDRDTVTGWARRMEYNIDYWYNGVRYQHGATNFPDPFLRVDGVSYYGFDKDEKTGKLAYSSRVSTKVNNTVDEVYSQHFLKAPEKKKRRQKTPSTVQLEQLEQTVKDAF